MKLPAKFIALTRVIALDQGARRGAIFALVLASLGMLFLGSTLFYRYLESHSWAFIIYWLACLWLTLTFMLLAVYDMLAIFLAGRHLRRNLEQELVRKQNSSTKQSSSTTSPDP